MDAFTASSTQAARSSDRAVLIWGMMIAAIAALGGDAALIAAGIAIPLAPTSVGVRVRLVLIFISLLAYVLGPTALIMGAPAAFASVGLRMAAARALFTLVAVTMLASRFETLPVVSWLSIHPGSTSFVILPAVVVALSFGPIIGWCAIAALAIGAASILAMLDAGATRWIDHIMFTHPIFRLSLTLIPVGLASVILRPQDDVRQGWRELAVGAAIGAIIAIALPSRPVTSIMFDEAHGTWETVKASFGPEDFGRGENYTYSLLFKYAERFVGAATMLESEDSPLPANGIFVLKMPTLSLSNAFADRLEDWVRGGGRLLVVADHTDLYDTTQNLNSFLAPRFGLKLNADAVYNPYGLPTAPVTERFAALFGRVDAIGRPTPWQTGTSLAAVPANTVALATYGPSYSEPGDYSRQNRFGAFAPRTSLRFTDHVAVATFGVDRGAVAVILDSTPWSNFSLFKEQYRRIFRGIVRALEQPAALQVWGWGALVLAGIAIAVALWHHPIVLSIGGVVLGLVIGTSAQIGQAAFMTTIEGRDYGLRVVPGTPARFEFLKQLTGPGERNYSRIVSAMAKYDFAPVASTPGSEVPELTEATRWLLIEPDPQQLPRFEDVVQHLQRGADLIILFAPNQAANQAEREWLASFGLYVQKTVGLAVAEDAQPGLLNRRGPALLRDIRAVTGVLPSSVLKDREFAPLLQSYTVRPTTLPRTSGLLTIGFSADQFSDDAVGEVWDGIHPASLGRHRERQLATALIGEGFLAPFPDNLVAPISTPATTTSLPAYALFNNGKTVISGRFDGITSTLRSPLENAVGYLATLRDHVTVFIVTSCPKAGQITTCNKRLLGPSAIEWMVTWVADGKGQIKTAELLHERRFSGMGSTVNVVFGQ